LQPRRHVAGDCFSIAAFFACSCKPTTSRNVRSLLGPVCWEPSCIKQRAQQVCRQRRRLHRGCQQGCRRCTDWRRCACAACRTGPAGRTAPPMRPPLPVKTAAPVSLLLCALKPLLAAQTVPPQICLHNLVSCSVPCCRRMPQSALCSFLSGRNSQCRLYQVARCPRSLFLCSIPRCTEPLCCTERPLVMSN
jgi:hypothetical protein